MVKSKATDHGEEYDYCRQCKKELKELIKPISVNWRATLRSYITECRAKPNRRPGPIVLAFEDRSSTIPPEAFDRFVEAYLDVLKNSKTEAVTFVV